MKIQRGDKRAETEQKAEKKEQKKSEVHNQTVEMKVTEPSNPFS